MALFRCASGSSGGGATITVTYSSDFYGETVTCSHGTKTYSKVATSSGTLEFSVDEEGTWTISCTIGSDTFTTTADVDLTYDAELVSLPNGETVLPTDDIETWLACAAITDKAYTTLSQVLGDSETYNALLGDSNACAYMKRSTTWSTDICADQYAMNLLGQYDTACDALLSDSTWASAIANSTYFESVLNVKVPVMTSNTTPSGVAFSSTEHDPPTYSPYKAFDNNSSTVWMATSGNGQYLGYQFTAPVKVVKVSFTGNNGDWVMGDFKVQGSTDGTTYDDLASGTASSPAEVIVNFDNDSYYDYYRILQNGGAANFRQIKEAQFYGRASSSEMVHGANGESAYILDGGSPVTITDPSTLDTGTYTVYSTVAKNPSDLTADYSKTIRICPNTKEIVVRPDNALYWWGYNNGEIEIASTANGWTFNGTVVPATFQTNYINVKANAGNTQSGAGTRNTITGKTTASLIYTVGTGGYARYLMGASKDCNVLPSGLVYNDLTTVGTTLTKVDLNIENKTGYVYVNCHNNSEVNIWALLAE